MDRVWLRDYEKMLSWNHREVHRHHLFNSDDSRRNSCGVARKTTRGVQSASGRPRSKSAKRKKKEGESFVSELDVARAIALSSAEAEYDRREPEKRERLELHRRAAQQQEKRKEDASQRVLQHSFQKIVSFEEFKRREMLQKECLVTGDSELFRELYPPVSPDAFSPIKKTLSQRQNEKKKRPMSSPQFRSSPRMTFQQKCVTEADSTLRPTRPPIQFENSLAKQATAMWREALLELRSRGQSIVYDHLSQFSRKWKRCHQISQMAAYVSILLGLKDATNDSGSAQRSLFRELFTLLKFFREVNPLTIPRRRIVKANNYYSNNMKEGITDVLEILTSEYKFAHDILKWIEAMQSIFTIILNAKNKHSILNANFEESLGRIQADYDALDPNSASPLKNMKDKDTLSPEQRQWLRDRFNPTGCWSTHLTYAGKTQHNSNNASNKIADEKSHGETLSMFDSKSAESFLDVSNSANIPLEEMSLEYSPDKSCVSPKLTVDTSDSQDEDLFRQLNNEEVSSPAI